MIIKSVTLTEKQCEFVDKQMRNFNLSSFVRDKLDEYIDFKEEL